MVDRAFDAIVVGTGAAGYNAANRIREGGRSVAIITEGVNCGTSRNTGSDKQTYYKLGLAGDSPDSVRIMAEDLFAGGCVDGDNALCEAALSARCFLNLAELGVPFPTNRYGEFVGYKTDHDSRARATSAGPLTSKFMTEALEKQTNRLEIPVFDNLLAVDVLKDAQGVCGLLCLNQKTGALEAFRSGNVVLATGGPAGIYADSVYPMGHTGSTGLALSAGACLQNMTEWQYGLASVDPRWNVSGTYMQVLPRFVSVDDRGTEREFLLEYFGDPVKALDAVFLKGYQWPFDSAKALDGSSVIDLLVYRERVLRGRRVCLDYRANPFGFREIPYEKLSEEARSYLQKAESCFGAPIDRLRKMNAPAIELYRGKGMDIEGAYLEIALCAQHNNGGIAVDLWWQTEVPGLFAVGECAGTHGISRPGGSALNAGQVGSFRAAQYICARGREMPMEQTFFAAAAAAKEKHLALWHDGSGAVREMTENARRRMSDCAGAIRNPEKIRQTLEQVKQELQKPLRGDTPAERVQGYRLRDLLLTQWAVLEAMADFACQVGASRGSALYTDADGLLKPGMEEIFRFRTGTGDSGNRIQQVRLEKEKCQISWRPVRPIPENDDFFENVWRQYRENGNKLL